MSRLASMSAFCIEARPLRGLVPKQSCLPEGEGREARRQTTHVEAYITRLKDPGSIPGTSTILKSHCLFIRIRLERLYYFVNNEKFYQAH